jgi:5'-nucleotidase
MLDPYLNLFRVKPEDGSLLNTDGLYEIEALGPDGAGKFLDMGKTFQGGNWKHLQAMLGTQAGEEILYVGDHLYSDVLRSKRTLGWRSAFIMPELEEEMKVFSENADILKSINKLRELRGDIEALTERYHLEEATKVSYQEQINAIKQVDAVLKEKLVHLSEMWHGKFHPIWGAIFNAGYQDSRFAFYVENYACLYTSKATNLGLSSVSKSYRTSGEMLPHDKLLVDPTTVYCDVNE